VGQCSVARIRPATLSVVNRASPSVNWSEENPESPHSGGIGLSWAIGESERSTRAGTPRACANSIMGTISSSGRVTRPTDAKAWEAVVGSHVLQDVRTPIAAAFSHILFMLTACPQSLHVMKVPPAMSLVVDVHVLRLRFIGRRCGGIGTPPKVVALKSKG
jgi:hypothetical protein